MELKIFNQYHYRFSMQNSLFGSNMKELWKVLSVNIWRLRAQSAGSGGCRIHRLHLCREVRPPPKECPVAQSDVAVEYTGCFSAEGWDSSNECPGYDTKQSDAEVPVMLGLWGMLGTPSLPLHPGPLWPGVVAPDRVLSMDQIELNCALMLNWIVWNRTVFVCWTGLFEI